MSSFSVTTPASFEKDGAPPTEQSPPSPTSSAYSPITPTMSTVLPAPNNVPTIQTQHAPPPDLHTQNATAFSHNIQTQNQPHDTIADQARLPQQPEHQPLPPSQPISLDDNSDAIALRAAMGILQIQRQQALRDMKTLEMRKAKALADPDAFSRAVMEGKIKTRGMVGIIPAVEERGQVENKLHSDSDQETNDDAARGEENDKDSFGVIPSAQNVVRMPPVNWNKYHVVGESLDKLHEEQRVRPSLGQPLRNEDLRPRERARESVIAAPYDPWEDRLGEKGTRTRSGATRKS